MMRKYSLLYIGFLIFLATHADAQEAWCTANPSNCVCADWFQSTTYTYRGGNAAYIGDQVGSKPCFWGDNINNTFSVAWSYVNGSTFSSNLLIRDASTDSDSENAMDRLPAGNSVARFLRTVSGYSGAFRFGDAQINLSGLASERIAMRWYSYHSADYQWAYDGGCTNGKIAHNSADYQQPALITLTVSGGATSLYSFGDPGTQGTFGLWSWPGHSNFGGFNSGSGPRPGSGVDSHNYRGKWYRHEIVVEHPRAASSGGYNFHYYVKNITDNTPEVEDVRFSSNCNGCGLFPDNSNNWRWDSGVHPTNDMDWLHTEFYRAGTCSGWQGWAYMTVASWPTDAGQRIGAATEVEGGGIPPDTTPPAKPTGLRVQ